VDTFDLFTMRLNVSFVCIVLSINCNILSYCDLLNIIVSFDSFLMVKKKKTNVKRRKISCKGFLLSKSKNQECDGRQHSLVKLDDWQQTKNDIRLFM
jgi:hypothetical protein